MYVHINDLAVKQQESLTTQVVMLFRVCHNGRSTLVFAFLDLGNLEHANPHVNRGHPSGWGSLNPCW